MLFDSWHGLVVGITFKAKLFYHKALIMKSTEPFFERTQMSLVEWQTPLL